MDCAWGDVRSKRLVVGPARAREYGIWSVTRVETQIWRWSGAVKARIT